MKKRVKEKKSLNKSLAADQTCLSFLFLFLSVTKKCFPFIGMAFVRHMCVRSQDPILHSVAELPTKMAQKKAGDDLWPLSTYRKVASLEILENQHFIEFQNCAYTPEEKKRTIEPCELRHSKFVP